MANSDDGNGKRGEALRQLRRYNAGLARMGVPSRVPLKMAREAPDDELERLLAEALHHYLDVLYQLRGTT